MGEKMNAAELNALADRVEALTGPDREVELAIWRLVDPRAPEVEAAGKRPLEWLHCYTASIDAARTLLPGVYLRLEIVDGRARALAVTGNWIEAAAPALAITAAALRARAQEIKA